MRHRDAVSNNRRSGAASSKDLALAGAASIFRSDCCFAGCDRCKRLLRRQRIWRVHRWVRRSRSRTQRHPPAGALAIGAENAHRHCHAERNPAWAGPNNSRHIGGDRPSSIAWDKSKALSAFETVRRALSATYAETKSDWGADSKRKVLLLDCRSQGSSEHA